MCLTLSLGPDIWLLERFTGMVTKLLVQIETKKHIPTKLFLIFIIKLIISKKRKNILNERDGRSLKLLVKSNCLKNKNSRTAMFNSESISIPRQKLEENSRDIN